MKKRLLLLWMLLVAMATGAWAQKYVVVGSESSIFGSAWDSTNEDNLMTQQADGTYTKTYTDVPAMQGIELKVVKDRNDWIGGADGNNVVVNLTEQSDFTVVYNPSLGYVTIIIGNSGKTVYVYPKSVNTVGEQVVLWSWPLGGEGKWTKGIPDDTYTGCYRFEIPIDHNNCVACIIAETDPIAWDRVEAKSNDLSLPSETDGVLIVFPTFTPETLPVLPTDVTTIDHLSDYVDDEPTNWDAVWAEYAYNGELGNIYTPEQTVFKIWNPLAKKVSLKRYATGTDAETDAKTLGTIEMEQLMDGDRWTGVWTTFVYGDINGSYYTYDVDGTEMPDPWSKAVGYDGKRSMVCDLSRTEPDGWENDVHVFYERGNKIESIDVPTFSADPMCGISEQDRGKYLALTVEGTTYENAGEQLTCMSKLKESGTKAIILTITDPQAVPDQYSRNPYDGATVVNEVKQVVQAVHKDFGMSFFVRFDFSTTPVLEPMTSFYIQEICKYWVWEYHADGIVLAADIDAETKAAIREALDALDTRLILGTEEEIMSGDGLAKDDEGNYLLATAADWKAFAALIETEPTANAKMTEDIDLGDDQTMVGTVEHPYQGTFDGGGHTLNVNYDCDLFVVGPFRYVKDATISRLHVDGTAKTTDYVVGGIVGWGVSSEHSTTIRECWSSATLQARNVGDAQGTLGGILGVAYGSEVVIEDCLFSGSILKNPQFWGGFVSHSDGTGGKLTIINSLNVGNFSGTYDTGTFYREVQNYFNNTISNSYYFHDAGVRQGIKATEENLANGTITYALLAYRAEDIWVQSELTNTPMLKIFADEGTYTAIRSTVNRQSPMVNGQYYDLSGRKVKNPGKGIYIYNGKKVMK